MKMDKKTYLQALEDVFEELDKERERWVRNEEADRRDQRKPRNGDASGAVWDCMTRIRQLMEIAEERDRTICGGKLK